MKRPTSDAGDVFTPHAAKRAKPGARAALYMRVSTGEQTVANQRPDLEKIAKARGLTIVREYTETQSAAKSRPYFDRMLLDAHSGGFDVLLVWSLDRFGRSAIGNLQDVLELDAKRVQVVSAKESWLEMDGPVRKLLIFIISWVAEQERNRLIERTKAGMARARAAGRVVGRPRAHVPLAMARELLKEHSRVVVARKLGTSPASLARALARAATSPKGVSRRKGAK
jgi:DNA invertase Pin-like site-specific DNA recombinase